MSVGGVFVNAEIAGTLKLVVVGFIVQVDGFLNKGFGNVQRVRIDVVDEGLSFLAFIGIGYVEQTLEQSHFRFLCMVDVHPVDGGFHLAVAQRQTALGLRVVSDVVPSLIPPRPVASVC